MRIDTTNRSSGITGRSAAGRVGSGPAFVPAGETGAARIANAAPVTAMTGLDAILALQTVGDFAESRRRAVSRGRSLLDLLEAMKADLLVGRPTPEKLGAMASQLNAMRERVEADLDALIDDIELRVRVELAKHGLYPPF